jgi:DNA-binding MarR family transcriptional regulator
MLSPCHCNRIRLAARRVSASYDAALAPLGINIAQYGLLRLVDRRGADAPSLTELGRLAELDRSTIGRNMRVLERMGLLALTRGADQREAVVRLTAAGAALLADARPAWEACQSALESRLGPDGVGQLDHLLQRL